MRIPRFRVRTLMIAVAVVAVVAAPVTWRLREIERQRRELEMLNYISLDFAIAGDQLFREVERQRQLEMLKHISLDFTITNDELLAIRNAKLLSGSPPAGSRVSVGPPAPAPETTRKPESK